MKLPTKATNHHHTYMQIASAWADGQSYATRRKVGAIIVKDSQILSHGHNGTISGFDNRCEDKDGNTNTDHVLHAESNAISKVAKSTNSSFGATLYTTDAPCIDCAKLIIQSGIKTVFYQRNYRGIGIDLLLTAGVEVYHIDTNGEFRKYDIMTDHSFFKQSDVPKFIKMDMNVVELFRKLFKIKPVNCSEINFGNKHEIRIKLKPEYMINYEFSNINKFLEFQKRNDSDNGWLLTCTGSVTYNDVNRKNVFSLTTPEIIEDGKTLKFSTYYEEDRDRHSYGDLYATGDIPFSAIESLRVISK